MSSTADFYSIDQPGVFRRADCGQRERGPVGNTLLQPLNTPLRFGHPLLSQNPLLHRLPTRIPSAEGVLQVWQTNKRSAPALRA